MIMTIMGFYDTTRILTDWSRMALAADAVAQIATNFLIDPSNDDPAMMQDTSAREATDAVFAYLPDWRRLRSDRFSITLTSVHSNGDAASTVWSYSSGYGKKVRRPCGKLKAGGDEAMDEVPAPVMKNPDFFVVDVAFAYHPMFLRFFKSSFDFKTTSYLPIRSFTTIRYVDFDAPSNQNLTYCVGD